MGIKKGDKIRVLTCPGCHRNFYTREYEATFKCAKCREGDNALQQGEN